jgi:superfamily II DNA or RNA helicase
MEGKKMTNYALTFQDGSILLEGADRESVPIPGFVWDERVLLWRAPGNSYREIMLHCHSLGLKLVDKARSYQKLAFELSETIEPRYHQGVALKAWQEKGSYGVISLPTGAGKTILAVLAISIISRPTLVVVPTLDLLEQWRHLLQKFFGQNIGVLGGGVREIAPITVATYNSAALTIEKEGNRFGFLVCDECHHLPAPHFQLIGLGCIAPFRMGLSATLDRIDGGEKVIFDLLGPKVYEGYIGDMVNKVLAPYDVVTIEVPLTDEEHVIYTSAREIYIGFIRRNGISMGSAQGWGEFLKKASFRPGGREAMKAHRLQKKMAQGASMKVAKLWQLLKEHWQDRVLVFTNDNELAYRIGRELLLPVITHQTKLKERGSFLKQFREGSMRVLVTSKVLNEGVDVPEARIGIVVSGSSGVREHVQRLGRILRHQPGKRAVLYELISKDTSEYFVKERRRQHHAYQRSP